MDVITYIRNTILFDKINEININNKEKALMNFISRPIISVYNKDEKNEFAEFYENYEDKSFDKYYEEITELVNKNKLYYQIVFYYIDKYQQLKFFKIHKYYTTLFQNL